MTYNMTSSKKRVFIVLFVIFELVLLLIVSLYQATEKRSYNTKSESFQVLAPSSTVPPITSRCRAWYEWTRSYRKCLTNSLRSPNSSYWLDFHKSVSSCLGDSTWDVMNINFLPNNDDVKLFILPSELNNESQCVQVTLGVGNDVASETKLKTLLPNCQLHGADPMVNVGRVFETVGQYYEMAVAANTGRFNANVLIGPGIYDYAMKPVRTTAFVDFLLENVQQKQVDYLFMDNEGAEYEILPLFVGETNLTNNDIVICQISVEMHGPLKNYNMSNDKYNDLMNDLLIKSPLVPIWSTQPSVHVRMFLLDAENEYCVASYLQNWCSSVTI